MCFIKIKLCYMASWRSLRNETKNRIKTCELYSLLNGSFQSSLLKHELGPLGMSFNFNLWILRESYVKQLRSQRVVTFLAVFLPYPETIAGQTTGCHLEGELLPEQRIVPEAPLQERALQNRLVGYDFLGRERGWVDAHVPEYLHKTGCHSF